MREPPNIAVDALRACLRERYGLVATSLEFLERGHDYRAGVYRVASERGATYLLKVTARPLYEPGLTVPRYLRDCGIAAVVAPIPTTDGSLSARLGEWTLIVYPFHDGDTSLTGMTDGHWRAAGATFRHIHQTPLPPTGFAALRREAFDPHGYATWIDAFEGQHLLPAQAGGSASDPVRELCALWVAQRPTIHQGLVALEGLAAALRMRALPAVICHADLHAANLLRDRMSQVFVIDWDEVMLAPKERDFIFIREPQAAAFWAGYGLDPTDATNVGDALDWTALAYFRWERVIQDLIEEAQQVLRDDVGEAAKAVAAQRFAASFVAGSNLDAARAAAAHLPPDLRLPDAPA